MKGHKKYRRDLEDTARRVAQEESVEFVQMFTGGSDHLRFEFRVGAHITTSTAAATPKNPDHGLNFARQQMRRAIVAEKNRQRG